MVNSVTRSCWGVALMMLIVGAACAAPAAPVKAPDAATGAKIKALQTERRDALRKALQAREVAFEAGRITFDSLVEVSRLLLEAELALLTTQAQRIVAHGAHVKLLKKAEETEQVRYEAGPTGLAEALLARAARLEAEIGLVRAGGKLKKEGK